MSSESLEKLVCAGSELSNIAFNMAQNHVVDDATRGTMDRCRRAWDDALHDFRKAEIRALESTPAQGLTDAAVQAAMDAYAAKNEELGEPVEYFPEAMEAALTAAMPHLSARTAPAEGDLSPSLTDCSAALDKAVDVICELTGESRHRISDDCRFDHLYDAANRIFSIARTVTATTAPVAGDVARARELLNTLWASFYDNKDGHLGDPKNHYRALMAMFDTARPAKAEGDAIWLRVIFPDGLVQFAPANTKPGFFESKGCVVVPITSEKQFAAELLANEKNYAAATTAPVVGDDLSEIVRTIELMRGALNTIALCEPGKKFNPQTYAERILRESYTARTVSRGESNG